MDEQTPKRPTRPTIERDHTFESSAEFDVRWRRAVLVFHADLEAWEEAETTRFVASGQAVYAKVLEAEQEAKATQRIGGLRDSLRDCQCQLHITLAEFRDWMACHEHFGGTRFEFGPSQEFEWFGGSVLVVVR